MNTTATAPAAAPKTVGVQARSNLREYGLMIALVVIMVLFQVLTHGTLFKPLNLTNRHHGAGYAAGDCCRPHRPFGGFGGRLHWSACRGFDGELGHAFRASDDCVPYRWRRDWGSSGLLDCLPQNTLFHRYVSLNAGL